MNELEKTTKKFEEIKQIDKYGVARELMLENNPIEDHFSHLGKMVEIGSRSKRKKKDYKLSRYACYLIVRKMKGDFIKEI